MDVVPIVAGSARVRRALAVERSSATYRRELVRIAWLFGRAPLYAHVLRVRLVWPRLIPSSLAHPGSGTPRTMTFVWSDQAVAPMSGDALRRVSSARVTRPLHKS